MTQTLKQINVSYQDRQTTLTLAARSAFIISALLVELESVRRSNPDKSSRQQARQAEQFLSALYQRLGSGIPEEYLANKAGEMTVKSMHLTLQKLETMYQSGAFSSDG